MTRNYGGNPVNCQGIVSLSRNDFRLGPLLPRAIFATSTFKDMTKEYYGFQLMCRIEWNRWPRENWERENERDGASESGKDESDLHGLARRVSKLDLVSSFYERFVIGKRRQSPRPFERSIPIVLVLSLGRRRR